MSERRFPILAGCVTAGLLASAAGAAGGCRKDTSAQDRQAAVDRQVAGFQRGAKWEEAPVSLPQEPTSVAQGKSPVIHLFDIGGPIAVMDLTTKARLVQADVANGTLVRVDARNGVTVGKERLFPGPLDPGHEYGIFALPATPGVIRQGVGVPGDVPRQ